MIIVYKKYHMQWNIRLDNHRQEMKFFCCLCFSFVSPHFSTFFPQFFKTVSEFLSVLPFTLSYVPLYFFFFFSFLLPSLSHSFSFPLFSLFSLFSTSSSFCIFSRFSLVKPALNQRISTHRIDNSKSIRS